MLEIQKCYAWNGIENIGLNATSRALPCLWIVTDETHVNVNLVSLV